VDGRGNAGCPSRHQHIVHFCWCDRRGGIGHRPDFHRDTGGAEFLASILLVDASPAIVLSAFFLLVAVLANVISTKATAVLFTPIAVGIAKGLSLPVEPFAVAVVFAANCSFASPIGYQTNLLVMAPGNYRFTDFIRVGTTLLIIVWLVFSFVAPWY
jgi:di/tricarboxylate transporter